MAAEAARRIQRERLEAPKQPALSLEEALAMMLAAAERNGRAAATLTFYLGKAAPLLRILGNERDVHSLGLQSSERYWDTRELEGAGAHTIKKELGMLRTALRHAKKHNLYSGDPSRVMPDGLANAYTPGVRALTVAEYRALRLALPAKRRPHLDAYVSLGVSASVLYRITSAHVDDPQK
jgi:hypothetical protein